eukprot:Nk52_evm1s244 gene=Nk52_evmTU1s244
MVATRRQRRGGREEKEGEGGGEGGAEGEGGEKSGREGIMLCCRLKRISDGGPCEFRYQAKACKTIDELKVKLKKAAKGDACLRRKLEEAAADKSVEKQFWEKAVEDDLKASVEEAGREYLTHLKTEHGLAQEEEGVKRGEEDEEGEEEGEAQDAGLEKGSEETSEKVGLQIKGCMLKSCRVEGFKSERELKTHLWSEHVMALVSRVLYRHRPDKERPSNVKKVDKTDLEVVEKEEGYVYKMEKNRRKVTVVDNMARVLEEVTDIDGVHYSLLEFQCPVEGCAATFKSFGGTRYHLERIIHEGMTVPLEKTSRGESPEANTGVVEKPRDKDESTKGRKRKREGKVEAFVIPCPIQDCPDTLKSFGGLVYHITSKHTKFDKKKGELIEFFDEMKQVIVRWGELCSPKLEIKPNDKLKGPLEDLIAKSLSNIEELKQNPRCRNKPEQLKLRSQAKDNVKAVKSFINDQKLVQLSALTYFVPVQREPKPRLKKRRVILRPKAKEKGQDPPEPLILPICYKDRASVNTPLTRAAVAFFSQQVQQREQCASEDATMVNCISEELKHLFFPKVNFCYANSANDLRHYAVAPSIAPEQSLKRSLPILVDCVSSESFPKISSSFDKADSSPKRVNEAGSDKWIIDIPLFESAALRPLDFLMNCGGNIKKIETCPLSEKAVWLYQKLKEELPGDCDSDLPEEPTHSYVAVLARNDLRAFSVHPRPYIERDDALFTGNCVLPCEEHTEKSLIQIWKIPLSNAKGELPMLQYGIAFDIGPVISFEWVPLLVPNIGGSRQHRYDYNAHPILGIISVLFGDGVVRMYFVPNSSGIQNIDKNCNVLLEEDKSLPFQCIQPFCTLEQRNCWPTAMAWSDARLEDTEDGDVPLLAIGCHNGIVSVWNPLGRMMHQKSTGEKGGEAFKCAYLKTPVASFRASDRDITRVAWVRNSQEYLYCGSQGGVVSMWKVPAGTQHFGHGSFHSLHHVSKSPVWMNFGKSSVSVSSVIVPVSCPTAGEIGEGGEPTFRVHVGFSNGILKEYSSKGLRSQPDAFHMNISGGWGNLFAGAEQNISALCFAVNSSSAVPTFACCNSKGIVDVNLWFSKRTSSTKNLYRLKYHSSKTNAKANTGHVAPGKNRSKGKRSERSELLDEDANDKEVRSLPSQYLEYTSLKYEPAEKQNEPILDAETILISDLYIQKTQLLDKKLLHKAFFKDKKRYMIDAEGNRRPLNPFTDGENHDLGREEAFRKEFDKYVPPLHFPECMLHPIHACTWIGFNSTSSSGMVISGGAAGMARAMMFESGGAP